MSDVLARLPASLRQQLLSAEGVGGRPALPSGLPFLDELLPEGGVPRGAVTELASPRGLGRATSLALALCASAQAEARQRSSEGTLGAFCAFLDPLASLHAPGVRLTGVDLSRLLVVRPPSGLLARAAARVASSHAFAVVVIDLAGVPGEEGRDEDLGRWGTQVRRLALAVEGTDTVVLLLTDLLEPRAASLPVALRLELERRSEDQLGLRVAKDRRGRVGPATAVPWPSGLRKAVVLEAASPSPLHALKSALKSA